jgi:hypothetical protein
MIAEQTNLFVAAIRFFNFDRDFFLIPLKRQE